jgi:hypothetical protein
MKALAATVMSLAVAAAAAAAAAAQANLELKIARAESPLSSTAGSDDFPGSLCVDLLFRANEPARSLAKGLLHLRCRKGVNT